MPRHCSSSAALATFPAMPRLMIAGLVTKLSSPTIWMRLPCRSVYAEAARRVGSLVLAERPLRKAATTLKGGR
jgi:hypothetical protein